MLAYLFAVGLGSLMFIRRSWPVATLVLTCVLLFAYYAVRYPAVGLAVPVAAALYSAAEVGRVRAAIVTAGALTVLSTMARAGRGTTSGCCSATSSRPPSP